MLLAVRGDEAADRFQPLMREALAIADDGEDEIGAAWARVCLAQAAAAEGRFDEGEVMVREVEALYPGRPAELRAWGHILLAGAALEAADLEQAGEQARNALMLTDQTSNFAQAHGRALLALVEASAGRVVLAHQHADAAVAAARLIPGRRTLVMALTRAADAAVVSGQPQAAQPHLDELLGILRDLGTQSWAAEALELTAIVTAPTRPEAAAVLLGSADSLRGLLREERGGHAVVIKRLAACRHQVVTRLGEADAAAQARHGMTMHLAEVLTYARAELGAEAEARPAS
jgi:tetratricopeptide (TPR) repeat protein